MNNGCATTSVVVTVNPLPNAGSISGSPIVCPGATIMLTDGAAGGIWSSVTPASATVGSTGIVTGVAAGTSVISYTVSNGCGTVAATSTVTVNPLPVTGTITGTPVVCPAATTTLADAAGGGVWSSVTPTVASIGSLKGL